MNFRYVFEKKGEVAPENILENNLWIDVGNTVKDGVFDHHQDGGFGSAFEGVLRRTDCYEKIKSYIKSDRANAEIVIHVHEYPDIDCVFSVYAVYRMIEKKCDNPLSAFDKKIAEALMDYVNRIDGGREKCLSKSTLYAYFCKIGADLDDLQKRSQELIDEGAKLLELIVEKLEKADDEVNLFEMPLEEYIDVSSLKYYSDLQKKLEETNRSYHNDKRENRVIIKSINLWNTITKSMEPVKAAIWEKLPQGEDEYVFARDEDECILTVYPYKIKEENSIDGTTQVLIALNPNMAEAQKYSLLPLAEVIEQCEQIEEDLLYEQTKRYRRDHSKSREDGRFAEIPFYETSDPWYISEKGDIIDSPRAYSIIPYDRILSIIENDSSMTKMVSVLRYKGGNGHVDMEKVPDMGEISFGELFGRTREMIENIKDGQEIQHIFVYVKVDPSMLRYSNNWLKTCCLNMVGKKDSDFSKDNILQIDYRTCLYTDNSITILAAIDRYNKSLGSLINDNDLKESQICIDLKNLLEHQSELRSIGVSLSKTIQKITQNSEEIDRFNERLVSLNTRIEEDDLIVNPLEQEVYAFIKRTFGIENLKDSVTTSAQLLIKNAEQLRDRKADEDWRIKEEREKEEEQRKAKRDGRIQAGIGLVTIFAVFSAWVDAFDFLAKLVPGQDGSWSDILSCKPVFVIELIVMLFILLLGCIAGAYVIRAWRGADDKGGMREEEKPNVN